MEIRIRSWDKIDKELIYGWTDIYPDTRYEYMLFTGLLDKQGKEIYEGDIVISQGMRGIVVYQPPSFVIKRKLTNKTWQEFIRHYDEPQFQEVIGNIYENSELVE
jgi:uncharacterized phage protein (TIGR01671 family)